jgi:hypothetical protein
MGPVIDPDIDDTDKEGTRPAKGWKDRKGIKARGMTRQ